jgi:hypothetical protein
VYNEVYNQKPWEIEMHSQHSIEELEQSLKIAAQVAVLYGDAFLPVFNRLHAELMKSQNLRDNKNLAYQLAKSYLADKK